MKTRSITIIISILVISSLVFFFQKKLNSQANQFATHTIAEAGNSRVSISDPEVFPNSGSMFSELWSSPEYILLDQIPVDVMKHHARQPIITDQQIFIPILSSVPGILVFDRAGHFQRRMAFDIAPDVPSDIHIYPAANEILVGDSQLKRISVYDLEGVRKEDRQVGFHFLYFAYSPVSDRYIFYLANDGKQASEGTTLYAITITDAEFNVLHQLFPLSPLAFKAPYFSSQRFQVDFNKVYYNPDFSDQLYAVDYEGKIELVLDLQMADQAYVDEVKSLIEMPFTLANAEAMKAKLPVDYFLIGNQYIFVGNIPHKQRKDLVIQRNSSRSVLINSSTLVTNFGNHFNFGYTRPAFIVNGKCISLFKSRDYNLHWDNIDDKEQLSHLPGRLADNQWMMMIYNPNDKVWFPAKESTTPTSSVSIEIFPNPANQLCTIKLTGYEGDYGLQIYAVDGVMRYDDKGKIADGGVQLKVDVSNWTPGTYVVQCTQGNEVFAKSLIVQ